MITDNTIKGKVENLFKKYEKLESPTKKDKYFYNVLKISESGHYVAKNYLNETVILFNVLNNQRLSRAPNTVNLTLKFDKQCFLSENKKTTEEKKFTVLECNTDEEIKIKLFFDTVEKLFTHLSPTPTDDEIIDIIIEIVQLFSQIDSSENEVKGLWGELLIIYISKNKKKAAVAWHKNNESRYDFADYNEFLEVKATINNDRKHEFSYHQLNGNVKNLFVASILIREDLSAGLSVNDLKETIFTEISDLEIKRKIETLIIKTLGKKYDFLINKKYDLEYAKRNIRFYSSENVPKINIYDEGVSNITFVSDLSYSVELDITESKLLDNIL